MADQLTIADLVPDPPKVHPLVEDFTNRAIAFRGSVAQQIEFAVAGQLNMWMVQRFIDFCADRATALRDDAANPEIIAYAKGADLAAGFDPARKAIVGVLEWLRENVPTLTVDDVAYVVYTSLPSDDFSAGVPYTFSAKQTEPYVALLQVLLKTLSN